MQIPRSVPQNLSFHAEVRMSQRGYSKHDIELVRLFGTPVQDGYMVTRADVEALFRDLQRLERIEGTFLAEQGGAAVTVYRPGKKRRRRIMKQDHRSPKRHGCSMNSFVV